MITSKRKGNTNEWGEVRFVCYECGYREEKPKKDPYTGIQHGKGWSYICPECMSELEFQDDIEEDDNGNTIHEKW
jgi:DNA-directed RNA polymerase subunit RPC12/RpoP